MVEKVKISLCGFPHLLTSQIIKTKFKSMFCNIRKSNVWV